MFLYILLKRPVFSTSASEECKWLIYMRTLCYFGVCRYYSVASHCFIVNIEWLQLVTSKIMAFIMALLQHCSIQRRRLAWIMYAIVDACPFLKDISDMSGKRYWFTNWKRHQNATTIVKKSPNSTAINSFKYFEIEWASCESSFCIKDIFLRLCIANVVSDWRRI